MVPVNGWLWRGWFFLKLLESILVVITILCGYFCLFVCNFLELENACLKLTRTLKQIL